MRTKSKILTSALAAAALLASGLLTAGPAAATTGPADLEGLIYAAQGQSKCSPFALDLEIHKASTTGEALAGATFEVSLEGSIADARYSPAFWSPDYNSAENTEFWAALSELGSPETPETRARLEAARVAAIAANEADLNRGSVYVTTDASGVAQIPRILTTATCVENAYSTTVTVVEVEAPAGYTLDSTPLTATLTGVANPGGDPIAPVWTNGNGFDVTGESFTQVNTPATPGTPEPAPRPIVNG